MSLPLHLSDGWTMDSDSGDEARPSGSRSATDAEQPSRADTSAPTTTVHGTGTPSATSWMPRMSTAATHLFRQLKLWQRRPARIAEGMAGTGCLALGMQA
jgi:hypothetical protein